MTGARNPPDSESLEQPASVRDYNSFESDSIQLKQASADGFMVSRSFPFSCREVSSLGKKFWAVCWLGTSFLNIDYIMVAQGNAFIFVDNDDKRFLFAVIISVSSVLFFLCVLSSHRKQLQYHELVRVLAVALAIQTIASALLLVASIYAAIVSSVLFGISYSLSTLAIWNLLYQSVTPRTSTTAYTVFTVVLNVSMIVSSALLPLFSDLTLGVKNGVLTVLVSTVVAVAVFIVFIWCDDSTTSNSHQQLLQANEVPLLQESFDAADQSEDMSAIPILVVSSTS